MGKQTTPPPTTTAAHKFDPGRTDTGICQHRETPDGNVCAQEWNHVTHTTAAKAVDQDSGNEEKNSSSQPGQLLKDMAVSVDHPRDYCFHSMMVETCIPCWRSHAARMAKHVEELRASMALPIKERVETIIEKHVRQFYDYWKHHWLNVKDNPEEWIKNAAHYLSWGINRALPMVEQPSTSDVLANPDRGMGVRSEPEIQAAAEEIVTHTQILKTPHPEWRKKEVATIAAIISKHTAGDVEAALAELREMFPSGACSIEHVYRSGFGTPTPDEDDPIKVYECRWTVWVATMSRGKGATLPEAMTKVREWKAGEASNGRT